MSYLLLQRQKRAVAIVTQSNRQYDLFSACCDGSNERGLHLRVFANDSNNNINDNSNIGKYIWLPLSSKEDINNARSTLCSILNNSVVVNDSSLWQIVFTLKNENHYGMSWSPIWMLSRYMLCACGQLNNNWIGGKNKNTAALELDIKYIKPPSEGGYSLRLYTYLSGLYSNLSKISRQVNQNRAGPPSIPLSSLVSNTAITNVIDSMRAFGYAVISVDDEKARLISEAYKSLLTFYLEVPLEEKKKSFQSFDNDRYVGYTKDNTREWLQMRLWNSRRDKDRDVPFLWPNSFSHTDRNNIQAAVKFLTNATEEIFLEVGLCLGLGSKKYLQGLFRSEGSDNGQEQTITDSSIGSTVCRLFVYLDQEMNSTDHTYSLKNNATTTQQSSSSTIQSSNRSGAHSDMGVLTLSPASTIPCLNLLHPDTHNTLYPEAGDFLFFVALLYIYFLFFVFLFYNFLNIFLLLFYYYL